MASVENIHVTEQTSDAKQSDREQDSIEVFEDDFDDSVLSFSESSSVRLNFVAFFSLLHATYHTTRTLGLL